MIQFRGAGYGIRSGNNCPRNLYLVPWEAFTASDYRGERNPAIDELAGQVDYDEQAALIVAAVRFDETQRPTHGGYLHLPWSVDHLYGRILLTCHGTAFGWAYERLAAELVAQVNRYAGW